MMHSSTPPTVLLLPGWQNSGPTHWQSRWQALYGDLRVEQDDWYWPRRGDWMARLDEVVLEHQRQHPHNPPHTPSPRQVQLVAHSLGCHLVAAWAAHSRHTAWVHSALLVAPPDTQTPQLPPQLSTWRQPVRQRLPFPALLLFSDDDPWCAPDRAQALARDWGARSQSVGARGHVNGDSGLGDWPEGRALLAALGTDNAPPSGPGR